MKPSCDLGYTNNDIRQLVDPVALYRSIRGNCAGFCDGCTKGKHGVVVYPLDMEKYLANI